MMPRQPQRRRLRFLGLLACGLALAAGFFLLDRPAQLVTADELGSVLVQESFDKQGGFPAGWSGWTSKATGLTFGASSARALSAPHGLAVAGDSSVAGRVWANQVLPADVQAGAAVYLDSLIPAQVFVRGTKLNTAAPSYYALTVTRGLEISLDRVVNGQTARLATLNSAKYVSGKWVRVTIQAAGTTVRARVYDPAASTYLDGSGQWVAAPAWALSRTDTAITGAGQAGLGRAAQYNGTLVFDDFAAGTASTDATGSTTATTTPTATTTTTANGPNPQGRPAIPRHYNHIRVAMLAYEGNPMGAFEDRLLQQSVDVVVANTGILKHVAAVAPKTPALVYTNTSNLYLDLLVDWLTFADAQGLSREAAFYHAAKGIPFSGDSPSSRPVTWFWGVYRGGSSLANVTVDAHSSGSRIPFGAAGEAVYLGYPERFREINVSLASGAGGGWTGVLEYARQVDANMRPTAWATLPTRGDTTGGLAHTGRITFDPPADWKPASLDGTALLYYVRLRTARDGTAPVANTLLGRDFVGARGGTSGTVPAFDAAADANHDGYLDDAEYARRATGKDARFLYESRMLTESYGQMRYCTNPSAAGYRQWAVAYHLRMLRAQPRAGGLFMDNCDGKPPVQAGDVLESIGTYARDYGAMLQGISQAIAPRWILANTATEERADPVVAANPIYMEEFGLRPLADSYAAFEDMAAMVARRTQLATPAPLAVLDTHPQGGIQTDPRLQLASLAYYYLLSDPQATFLMLFGGCEPATTWQRHWLDAVGYDVGRPTGQWSVWTTGTDPGNAALSYKIYQRPFEKALVLFKPLSYARGSSQRASVGAETATTHDLGGTYRPLQADGTLGSPVTRVTLRNGEGAILIKK